MSDSEWEKVGRDELRKGDVVRWIVEDEGSWLGGGIDPLTARRTFRIERKVVKPSPEAMRAAEAVLMYEHGVYDPDELVCTARIIDKAYRGEQA